eukprot:13440.XXX_848626_853979_1 [CDS] Oithona nana genome sequencing.
MKIIFESGYDFNWQDDNENTAFHHAALGYENLEMLLKFVKNSERLGIGMILASTGSESILIGHHRVLKSQDHYTPDPVLTRILARKNEIPQDDKAQIRNRIDYLRFLIRFNIDFLNQVLDCKYPFMKEGNECVRVKFI